MSESPPALPEATLRKHLDKAAAAVRGQDPAYALGVCEALLEKEPGCVEARRVLRQAQRARAARGGPRGVFGAMRGRVALAKAAALCRSNPARALALMEKALGANPEYPAAHRLLGKTALELDLAETAVFAFEDLCRLRPGDAASYVALGKALVRAGRNADAVRAAAKALDLDSADSEAQALLKAASVAQTMGAGRVAESSAGSPAVEAAGGQGGSSGASVRARIAAATREFAENPEDARLARQIAADHARLDEPAEALRWIEVARATPSGAGDASLERLAFEYGEAALAKEAEDARAAADPKTGAALGEKLSAFRRDGLARLCLRYPSDGELRLRHGELLLESGDGARAAPEFQAALRDARVRAAARFGLGRSFLLAGKPDLARAQLEQAREAHSAMDDRGKAIRHALGEACEALGDTAAAAGHFKALYAVDVTYRDVAERVANYYGAESAGGPG